MAKRAPGSQPDHTTANDKSWDLVGGKETITSPATWKRTQRNGIIQKVRSFLGNKPREAQDSFKLSPEGKEHAKIETYVYDRENTGRQRPRGGCLGGGHTGAGNSG